MTFTLDKAPSALTISGTLNGVAIQQQGPGSLTTHYMGTIEADVTSSTIAFVGGSTIIGLDSGSWQPLPGGAPGSALANYGVSVVIPFFIDAKAAIRDAQFDVTSAPLPVAGGSFSSQGLVFNFPQVPTTMLDYNYTGTSSGSGSLPLTNTATNAVSTNSTLVGQGSDLLLTVPVDISGTATALNPDDVQYRLRGQMIARTPAPVPLNINSFQIAPGQLTFTIATTPGRALTIEGSTNLADWPEVVDQFTATNNPTIRSVPIPGGPPWHFFRVRRN